ncbi:MAG: polysaccharide biosynthesis/export family protein [Flammeovirgaceae bacterium]
MTNQKLHITSYQAYYILIFLFIFSSCTIKRNLLFQSPTSINPEVFEKTLMAAQKNYLVEKGDYLAISIFNVNGEKIIYETTDFPVENSADVLTPNQNAAIPQLQGNIDGNSIINLPIMRSNAYPNSYLVEEDGTVTLPRIGKISVDQLTLRQASDLIAKRYESLIESPYVVMQYLNKRVILMGALGDKVITLRNENMSLYEVLALASGNNGVVGGNARNMLSIQNDAKARSIRLVRNYQTDPSVLIIDLTTIEGISKLNTNIQPNDIIYIEPRRRFDRDSLNDISSVLSPIVSIVTLIVAVNALNR